MLLFADHSSSPEGYSGVCRFPRSLRGGKGLEPSFELAWFLENLFDPMPTPDKGDN